MPGARRRDHKLHITRLRSAGAAGSRDIDQRRLDAVGVTHRQHFGAIELCRDVLPGIERDTVPRRDPPQYAVHRVGAHRRDGRIAVGGDDEAMIGERGHADRRRGRRVAAHDVAVHVGAVGEVEHHVLCSATLGRVAAQTVTASATIGGSNAMTVKKPATTGHIRS